MVQFFKRFLLAALLALILLPVAQAKFHFWAEEGLYGAFVKAPHPDLTWSALRDNTYQPALERYLEDGIGFRSFFIQLRNQAAFSLFHVARSSDIIVGQRGVLFQPAPVAAYRGTDLLREEEIRLRVRRLRIVQQDLARRGVRLLYVLAPNKARFQPEDLPTHLRPSPGTRTNYEQFVRALRADSVALLDMVPVFARWKTTRPYPVFPRGGTHWSGYGATLAADTLLRRLEELGQVRFPRVRELGAPRIIQATDSLHGTDADISWALNLMWRVEPTALAYRRLAFDPPQTGQTRPSALFVGDSFTWGLVLFGPYMQREFADDTRFWYYNTTVHLPDTIYHPTGEKVGDQNLRQQIESRRFVILLLTEHNLVEREFGFTEQVYHLYHPLTEQDQQAINQLAATLKQQATWEEQSKEAEGFAQRIHQQAQDQYERQLLLAPARH